METNGPTFQEFYFGKDFFKANFLGISILMLAMCYGEIAGFLISHLVLSQLFNPSVFILVTLFPLYTLY